MSQAYSKTLIGQILGWHPDDFVFEKRPSIDLQSNDLYDLQSDTHHFILKAFLKEAELEEAPRREFDALKLLEPTNLAPKPIFFDATVGPFVIYEFLEGEMWDRKRPSSLQLAELAEAWLTINSLTVEKKWLARGSQYPVRFDWVEAHFKTYGAWAKTAVLPDKHLNKKLTAALTAIKPIFEKIDAATPKRLFSRSDPRFANFIQRPNGRLGMVDWEDSGWHDPAYAVADLLVHANQEDLLTREEWEPFFTAVFCRTYKK